MKWFLYAISLIWISVGCCTILYTNETKNIIRSLIKTIDQKILSILPFIFGILFLFYAKLNEYRTVSQIPSKVKSGIKRLF